MSHGVIACPDCGHEPKKARQELAEAVAKARADALDEAATELAGFAAITSLQPQKSVWQNAYKAVLRLKETGGTKS